MDCMVKESFFWYAENGQCYFFLNESGYNLCQTVGYWFNISALQTREKEGNQNLSAVYEVRVMQSRDCEAVTL